MTRDPSRRVASEPRWGRGAAFAAEAKHGTARGVLCAQDPDRMTPAARLVELGGLLAVGYRRIRLRQKALDESGEPEALCGQAVGGNRADSVEEMA